jgi:hypothetical protein
MVMIETSPGMRQSAEQSTDVEAEGSQPRRMRPPAPATSTDEPLVQIETRK